MNKKEIIYILIFMTVVFTLGFIGGFSNQSLQPIVADKFENIADNMLTNNLITATTGMNDTTKCEFLQNIYENSETGEQR